MVSTIAECHRNASVYINGQDAVQAGVLEVGQKQSTEIEIKVLSADGSDKTVYTLKIQRE